MRFINVMTKILINIILACIAIFCVLLILAILFGIYCTIIH